MALLSVGLSAAGIGQLHLRLLFSALSDQAGYATMARGLLEQGTLRPHLLYPAGLWLQEEISGHRIYMPGYYGILAASLAIFKALPGVLPLLMPSLLGFVVTPLLIFLCARRLAGERAGLLAAGMFLALPASQFFAVTAMMELSLAALAAAALWAFLLMPTRLRPYVGPLLLVPAFLCRETGSFLALPFALLILLQPDEVPLRARLRDAAVFSVLSVVLLGALWRSPLCLPRITLLPAYLFGFGDDAMYTDAVAQRFAARQPLGLWPGRLLANAAWNLSLFKKGFMMPIERPSLFIEIAAGLACLALARRRPLALGAGLLFLVAFTFLTLSYLLAFHNGVRFLHLTFPLCAVALAQAAAPVLADRGRRWAFPVALGLCGVGMVASAATVRAVFIEGRASDEQSAAHRAFVESLRHDDRTMLVAPFEVAAEYLLRHYPVDVSLPPANQKTLRVLARRHRVGTAVLPLPQGNQQLLAEYAALGLKPRGALTVLGQPYLVLQREAVGQKPAP